MQWLILKLLHKCVVQGFLDVIWGKGHVTKIAMKLMKLHTLSG